MKIELKLLIRFHGNISSYHQLKQLKQKMDTIPNIHAKYSVRLITTFVLIHLSYKNIQLFIYHNSQIVKYYKYNNSINKFQLPQNNVVVFTLLPATTPASFIKMSVEEVERVLLYSLESSVSSDEQRRTEVRKFRISR